MNGRTETNKDNEKQVIQNNKKTIRFISILRNSSKPILIEKLRTNLDKQAKR